MTKKDRQLEIAVEVRRLAEELGTLQENDMAVDARLARLCLELVEEFASTDGICIPAAIKQNVIKYLSLAKDLARVERRVKTAEALTDEP